MTRFLFDAHHLGRRQTGNEVWTRNVVRSMQPLVDEGEVEYAVTREGLDELRRLTDATAHVVNGSSPRRLAVDLPRIIRARAVDAVFVTYTAALTRRPIVTLVHDMSAWHVGARSWLPQRTRLQYQATVGASARLAHHVLAPSEFTRRDVVQRLGLRPERVSVATDAVDSELGELLVATPRRRPYGSFRVLAVGNVVPRKNLTTLAEAVRACRDLGLDVHLRIVGSVPKEGRAISDRVRGLLGPHVELTGYVSPTVLAQEYKDADALGFPSLLEGFGIPVVEAMTASLPVVVSSTSALPEVAGAAALVLDPDDVRGWRDALLQLQGDPDLCDRLCRRGLVRAARFSWLDAATVVVDRLRAAAVRPSSRLLLVRDRSTK